MVRIHPAPPIGKNNKVPHQKISIRIKRYSHIVTIAAAFVITLLAYFWFASSSYYSLMLSWSHQNSFLLFSILVVIKVFGIVWPPIPGAVLTIGSIPFLGWFNAYLADFIGNYLGSSIAFYIGARWGFAFMGKIFDENTIRKISRIKIKSHREIETIFVLSLFGGIVFEAICYGSGLLKTKYKNFVIGTILSNIVWLPYFYIAEGIFAKRNLSINMISLLAIILVLFHLRHRFFEYGGAPEIIEVVDEVR